VAIDSEVEIFRQDLLNSVQARAQDDGVTNDVDFAFVCEVGTRLANAEEFYDFVPCHYTGLGPKNRKLRIDGYELDELDESIRLLIADFKGEAVTEVITKTRAEQIFGQLRSYIEESASGRIWASASNDTAQVRELSSIIEQKHQKKLDGTRSVSRYRLYLITDSILSERLKDLPTEYLDGIPVEFHIWDVSRLKAVSTSLLGTEELTIDFREFVEGGLPCLHAGQTDDYDGYLCVIPGEALADLYDQYGSKLLEGNVRSFLSTGVKINRIMQGTIRSEPDRFFAYNNGISATATAVEIQETDKGLRLVSANYWQIVNGGQTTASLHAAKRKDGAELGNISVQMKLSVVKARDSEMLDTMIQKIARFSNSQNKVNDADFFSNHPFHRAVERRSRTIKAPATEGAQFNTFWFYERTRGQYINAQAKMTLAQKKSFQREFPRSQLVTKTDLAKFENSWRKLPHIVSRHAQKNFLVFAELIGKEYGEEGIKFDNEAYFKEAIARAILFKFVEQLVSKAKNTWYGGDYRAQIVTYTIAKLVNSVEEQALGCVVNLKAIWTTQSVSPALASQVEAIAKVVSSAITTPPITNMNVGEWCKKEDCWEKVKALAIPLNPDFKAELLSTKEALKEDKAAQQQGKEDSIINAVFEVVRLRETGCWKQLLEWSSIHSPIFGTEADLVRNASRRNFVPSDKQAALLIKKLRSLEEEGFRAK
jgi:hypothetical protein